MSSLIMYYYFLLCSNCVANILSSYRVFLIVNYNDSDVDIYGVEYVCNDIYYIYVKEVILIEIPHLDQLS